MGTGGSLGEVIATGSRSTVHAWGNDAVAKVPLAGTPDAWIEAEATYSAAVRAAGAPVPEFLGLVEHEGRPASIYRRVRGTLMWDAAVVSARGAAAAGRALAELQRELAGVPAPVVLPALRDRLRAKLRRAARVVGDDLAGAAAAVGCERERVICHGDLHPGNVIVTGDGPIVVDWFDAARGDRRFDLARTSILLTTGDPGEHLRGADAAVLAAVHEAYVAAVVALHGVDPAAPARWRAVVAAARIAEGVASEPLLEVWRAWRSSGGAVDEGEQRVEDGG